MPHYQAYPQRPEETATPFKQPDRVDIISVAESVIIGASSRDSRLRDTCREYLGRFVPTSPALPRGDVEYCTSCHQFKSVRDFSPDARKVNGLKSHCKECCARAEKRRRLSA